MANERIGLDAILNDSNFQAGLRRYTSGLGQMESATNNTAGVLSRVGSVMSGAVVAGVGAMTVALGALTAASKIGLDNAMQWGEQLDKLGDQFGLTGTDAAKWAAAFSHVGLSVEEGAMGLNTFTRGLAEMAEQMKDPKAKPTDFAKTLQQLGIRATDAKGKLKTFDQIMPELMDAFKKLPPGIKATDAAMKLFGARGGTKFMDFLRQGKQGLKDAEKLVEEFGLEIESDGVNALEDFGFAMNDLNLKVKGLWTQIGLEVLPIVRRFVDYISTNVLPSINKFVRESLPKLIDGFNRFVVFAQTNLLPIWTRITTAFNQFVTAFQRGGLSGVFDELGRQLANAFKGFDAAKILGDLGGMLARELPKVWAKVAPELQKWGGRFWGWLTNDVIPNVASQMGAVASALTSWIDSNAPNWIKVFDKWARSFWDWLTNPNGGLIITVAENMGKLASSIEAWSQDENTIKQMNEVGATIARQVLDGMGRLFDQPATGDNLLVRLGRTLWNAAQSLANTFANIGSSIASGIVRAIAEKFFSAEVAQQIANAMGQLFRNIFAILIGPGGPIVQISTQIADRIIAEINARLRSIIPTLGQTPGGNNLGTGGGSIGSSGGSSGFGNAPTVSQPVSNNTSNRTVAVTFGQGAFANAFSNSGVSASSVEAIAQAIADKTVAAVMGVA